MADIIDLKGFNERRILDSRLTKTKDAAVVLTEREIKRYLNEVLHEQFSAYSQELVTTKKGELETRMEWQLSKLEHVFKEMITEKIDGLTERIVEKLLSREIEAEINKKLEAKIDKIKELLSKNNI